jgi:hypothetical protein
MEPRSSTQVTLLDDTTGIPNPKGSATDEKVAWKAIQAEFRRLISHLEPFTVLKLSDPEGPDQVLAALNKLPEPELFARVVADLRQHADSIAQSVSRARREAFGRVEAEFIRGLRDTGHTVRELASGWRIGPLELEVRREQARVRFLYNHEPLSGWTVVSDLDTMRAEERKALTLLRSAAIAEEELIDLFWDAYRACASRSDVTRGAQEVHVQEFYMELRLEQIRRELRSGKPDRKLKQTELPRWTFLYYVDSYRALRTEVPAPRRLGFQTGAMAESQTGITINGLDPEAEYRRVVYVTPAQI